MNAFFIGLDLGQRRDHTAIAIVERAERAQSILVRHLERVPLGTPYPNVVDRIRHLTGLPELSRRCSLTVDATGVGAPVVDMLRSAQLGCEVCAVTITSAARESQIGMNWAVPKQDLLAHIQVLLEHGELRIAKTMKDTGALIKELLSVKSRQLEHGRIRLGADGTGAHDDLVIALSLACWRANRKTGPVTHGRLF